MGDMTVPFIMLLILTIALVLERKHQEDKIVEIYEDKFEEWKKHSKIEATEKNCKELVGLVFLEDSKIEIQVLDKKVIDKLERKKFTIKV
ncbi:MAG: hypothetical protein CSA86_00250 [Arcobacter sp.]|nr:MAG: hypothetical protein CSA86_00250 [Arcobacter sp.]